jgi:hypothetical protein
MEVVSLRIPGSGRWIKSKLRYSIHFIQQKRDSHWAYLARMTVSFVFRMNPSLTGACSVWRALEGVSRKEGV